MWRRNLEAVCLGNSCTGLAWLRGFCCQNLGGLLAPGTRHMESRLKLRAVKALHTLVWAVFAGAIVAIPVCTLAGNMTLAWSLIGFVSIEVAVLLVNRMTCPLTAVAARYTTERQDNFDIYLPLWLARYNKVLFGVLYAVGVVYTLGVSLHAVG